MRQESVFFPCGELNLNGDCYYPDKIGNFPAVVLCHPHPLNGGSMSSSVIRALGKALVERSIVAFMFNFRGVGKSQGSYNNGIGEQGDTIAALDWIESQSLIDKEKIGLAGYSFGGGVAASVASRDIRVKTIALISPYLEPVAYNQLEDCYIPKYFITGGDDNLILPETVETIYKASSEPKRFEIVPGIDHFWFGFEESLAHKVEDFLSEVLT